MRPLVWRTRRYTQDVQLHDNNRSTTLVMWPSVNHLLGFAVAFLLAAVECVEQVAVSVGQTAVLPCHVEIQGNPQVSWKDKDLNTLTVNTEVLTDDRRFSVLRKYLNDWDLQINGVKLTDTGNYTCCFVVAGPCQTVKVVSLIIQIPPTITSITGDVAMATGSNRTLVCNATGIPQPTLKWMLYRQNNAAQGQELNASGVYSIVDARRGDAGRYECIANNGVPPMASRSLQVTVTFAPQVTVPYREVRQNLGTDTLLDCLIRANPPGEYYWEKGGVRVNESPGKHRLITWKGSDESEIFLNLAIFSLRPDDLGHYTCVARNTFGSDMDSTAITVWHNGTQRMVSPPKDTIAQAGQDVVIDCTVEGLADKDQLIWSYQNSSSDRYVKLFDSLTSGGRWSESVNGKLKYSIIGRFNLMIKSVAIGDAGTYSCSINVLGNYSAALNVVIPDTSVGSDCAALRGSVVSTPVIIAVVVSLVGVFIIVVAVVVSVIVRYYRRKLDKRRWEQPAFVKTQRFSSLDHSS